MAVKPRIDKSDPKVGSFRAALKSDWLDADINKVFAVGLDSDGLVVKGAGATGVVGIVIRTKKGDKAGDVVDVHTNGEVYPFVDTAGGAVDPGALYYGAANGNVNVTAAGGTLLGWATSDGRLILRVKHGANA